MLGFLLGLIPLLLVLPLIFYVRSQQRRRAEARTEAVKSAAARMRAEFRAEGSSDLATSLAEMPLCLLGTNRKLSNLLLNFPDQPGLSLLDYEFYQSSGKSGQFFRQTVACLEIERTPLPAFALRPESIIDKIAAKFGGQDIDFDSRPEFSTKYRLQGADEDAVRRAFRPELMAALEQMPPCHLECTGRRVIWFRSGVYIEPEALEGFARDAMTLFRKLQEP